MESMDEDSSHPQKQRVELLTWAGLLTLGWVLYELTAQPALGVIGLCLKLEWDDFRTAWWLRSRDASRRRGRTCFWLYTANGAYKAALVALVMVCGVIVVVALSGGKGKNNHLEHVAIGSVIMLGAGLLIATLATVRALWLAWR